MKGLTPIILILVSVGVFFFFIDPQNKELKVLQAEKAANDVTIEKATQLRKSMGDLNDKYKNISDEEKTKLAQALPDTVDNVRLILDLNNIATEYGITLTSVSVSGGPIDQKGNINNDPKANASSGSYGTIKISFGFSGSYDLFKTFIKALQDTRRLVDITDLSVSTSDAGIYNYSISLNTYWLR